MQKIHFAIRTLLHSRGSTLVKILSIGLGLAMSCFLFARVAYDNLIDTCFNDYGRIYQLNMQFKIGGNELAWQEMCVGKLTEGVYSALGEDMVEAAVMTRRFFGNNISRDNEILPGIVMVADSLFFKTFGVEIIDGDHNGLAQPGKMYISDRMARKYFGDESPVGRMLTGWDDIPIQVSGVYRDWGEESTINTDFIVSLSTLLENNWGGLGWKGGDSWFDYILVKDGTDPEALNRKIMEVIEANVPPTDDFSLKAAAIPLRDVYRGQESVRMSTWTLSLLATLILIVTALNYVLLSLSALSRRAKAIGVHKCSGAGRGTIFAMFAIETLIIIAVGLVFAAFCFYVARRFAQESIYDNFAAYISADRLWVVAGVVVLTFGIAALIPSVVFSKIPVSQVFRRFVEKKHRWKHSLLFVEFAGMSLMGGLLAMVIAQYHYIMDLDPGYEPDNVVCITRSNDGKEHREALMKVYASLPYVDQVAIGSMPPGYGYSGEFVRDDHGSPLFSSRYDNWNNKDFAELMGFRLLHGRYPEAIDGSEAVINQEFARLMGWKDNDAVGRQFRISDQNVTVCGIIKDFITGTLYQEQQPYMAMTEDNGWSQRFFLKLKEPFGQSYASLMADEKELMEGASNFSCVSLGTQYRQTYHSVEVFRTMIMTGAIILLFISMIGLFGYMRDEMHRRSREIAIRKVNGASTAEVIEMICRSVMTVAIPAVIFGSVAAWLIGRYWLEQFSVQAPSITAMYVLSGIITLILIALASTGMTLRTANENPSKSLRSE